MKNKYYILLFFIAFSSCRKNESITEKCYDEFISVLGNWNVIELHTYFLEGQIIKQEPFYFEVILKPDTFVFKNHSYNWRYECEANMLRINYSKTYNENFDILSKSKNYLKLKLVLLKPIINEVADSIVYNTQYFR